MLLEDLIFLVLAGGGSIFFIPYLIRLYKAVAPAPDPLKEAERRLRIAEAEAKAAELNQKTEKIYNHLYEDVLHEDEQNKENKGTRV